MWKISFSKILNKVVLDITLNGKDWERIVGVNQILAFLSIHSNELTDEMDGDIQDEMWNLDQA